MIGSSRRPGAGRRRGAAAVAWGGGRPRHRRDRAVRLPRPGPRTLAAVVAVIVALAGVYLWVRDSSLVAVQKVSVVGVSGPDAGQIRAALATAARNMTTLDVRMGPLRSAVAPYPVVKHLDVRTQFPHGMRIGVVEQVPVAAILVNGRRTAVSRDGTFLTGVSSIAALPTITLSVPPGGSRLSGFALSEVRVLAAAPYALLSRIGGVTDGPTHGLTVALRNGPSLYFGSTGRLDAKWMAATAVLGNSDSAGAVYVDVTDPKRPAAGAGTDSAAMAGAGAAVGAGAAAGTGGSNPTPSGATNGSGSG